MWSVQWSGSHGCYVPSQAVQKDEPFSIAYTHPCEPYVIALKASLPGFDGRWRGRMLDKTAYMTHMACWGFEFHVDPTSFMVHLPHASGVALKERPEDDPGDQVFADFWALPYALTRVFLGDIRNQPEARCEVLPAVRPLKEEDVVSVMREDGAKRPWCKDANIVDFDWAEIEKGFSAPQVCTAGSMCEDSSKGVGQQEGPKHGAEENSVEHDGHSQSQHSPGSVQHRSRGHSSADYGNNRGKSAQGQEGTGGDVMHMHDVAQNTKVHLRQKLNPAQGKETMLWSAAALGLLAWVLFVWFYQSTRRSSRPRRRLISMQLPSATHLDQ